MLFKEFQDGLEEKKTLAILNLYVALRESSGSVVECLTRDRGAAGSSLTGVTVLCP